VLNTDSYFGIVLQMEGKLMTRATESQKFFDLMINLKKNIYFFKVYATLKN